VIAIADASNARQLPPELRAEAHRQGLIPAAV